MTFPDEFFPPYIVRGPMGYTVSKQREGLTVISFGRHFAAGELTTNVWIPPGYLILD